MGARISHMNIYQISHITQLSIANCESMMLFVEDPTLDTDTLLFGVRTHVKAEEQAERERESERLRRALSEESLVVSEKDESSENNDLNPDGNDNSDDDNNNSTDNNSNSTSSRPAVVPVAEVKPFKNMYLLTVPEVHQLMSAFEVLPSDKDTIVQLFRLIDKKGSKVVDIRDVLVSVLVVVSKSVKECVDTAFLLYNRDCNFHPHSNPDPDTLTGSGRRDTDNGHTKSSSTTTTTATTNNSSSSNNNDSSADRREEGKMSKRALFRMISLLNIACSFFSDKHLEQALVEDLVDSVFAAAAPSSGLSHASPAKEEADKTERLLPFREFSDLIAQHPLVEMMISVQFQGPAKDKMGS